MTATLGAPSEIKYTSPYYVILRPDHLRLVGNDIGAALMLAHAMHMQELTDRGDYGMSDKNGRRWFHKTREQWEETLGLTRSQQERARQILRDAGIWEEKRMSNPGRLYYRVSLSIISSRLETCRQECGKLADKSAENLPPRTNKARTGSKEAEVRRKRLTDPTMRLNTPKRTKDDSAPPDEVETSREPRVPVPKKPRPAPVRSDSVSVLAALQRTQDARRAAAQAPPEKITRQTAGTFWGALVRQHHEGAPLMPLDAKGAAALAGNARTWGAQLTNITFNELLEWSIRNWTHVIRREFGWMENPPALPNPYFWIKHRQKFLDWRFKEDTLFGVDAKAPAATEQELAKLEQARRDAAHAADAARREREVLEQARRAPILTRRQVPVVPVESLQLDHLSPDTLAPWN